jgi:hypothetical protein
MIDYDKLNVAHELAEKLRSKDNYVVLDFELLFRSDGTVCQTYEYRPFKGDMLSFDNIDDLIAKLQELTRSKPKYEIGQEVWLLGLDNKAWRAEIDDYDSTAVECYFIKEDRWYREDELFPTREALIDAQIEYWHSKHCEDGRHEFIDDYTGYKSKCVHCDKPEFTKTCLKNQEKSTHYTMMYMASTPCEHESDGRIYCEGISDIAIRGQKLKCMKCGEFYK